MNGKLVVMNGKFTVGHLWSFALLLVLYSFNHARLYSISRWLFILVALMAFSDSYRYALPAAVTDSFNRLAVLCLLTRP